MINRTIDSVDRFAKRHRRAIAVLAGIWFTLSWAATAGFVRLPDVPLLTGTTGLIASTLAIALWWAWLSPRIAKRRSERDPVETMTETGRG